MMKKLLMTFVAVLAIVAVTIPVAAQTYTLTLATSNDDWGSIMLYYDGTDGVTVCDGETTNGYVPMYGLYADAYTHSEMIYPASLLTALPVGESINKITFYSQNESFTYGDANYKVYLAETSNATVSEFTDVSTMTLVYDGPLTLFNYKLVVNFTTGYEYNGGNLVVAIVGDQIGSYHGTYFYGISSEGSSVQGYSYSELSLVQPSQCNFLPKATFSLENSASDVVDNGDGTYSVAAGTQVIIRAEADDWYHITGWSDDMGTPIEGATYSDYDFDETFPAYSELTVTVDGDMTVTANFAENHYTVTLGENVSISDDPLPIGITINSDGTYDVFPETEFHVFATAPEHYQFSHWSDLYSWDDQYTENPRTVTGVYAPTTIEAVFVPETFTLTVASSDPSMGLVSLVSADGSVVFGNPAQVFDCTSGYQYGVATDGTYIYTSSWSDAIPDGFMFHQYNWNGDSIDAFTIEGVPAIRDLTTDGTYFYGGATGEDIYILDFTTRTLVGTITCPGLSARHISYDPVRDGFWSGGWDDLALYDREGNKIQDGPEVANVSGTVYFQDDNEHLLLFVQPESNGLVYDYNITTNTLSSEPVLDFNATTGAIGSSGGSFMGSFDGNLYWFGDSQQDSNRIGIFPIVTVPSAEFSISVPYGTEVTIKATPMSPSYDFVGWSNGVGANEDCTQTIIVDGDMTIYANFETHTDGIDAVERVSFTVAPNPAMRGQRVVVSVADAEGNLQGARLTVFDAQGRRLDDLSETATYEANLPAGVYMLRLTTADGRTATRRLVVR